MAIPNLQGIPESPTGSRQFSMKEVDEIIRRALQANASDNTTINEFELQEIADKLGISPHRLELAIRENENSGKLEKARAVWLKRKRRGFFEHLTAFLIVNGFIFMVNAITPGPWWFYWPMLSWSVGLAFHATAAFFPAEDKIDRGARRVLDRWRFT